MLQVLAFCKIANKDELIQACEKLKKIFISPLFTESILEIINDSKVIYFSKNLNWKKVHS